MKKQNLLWIFCFAAIGCASMGHLSGGRSSGFKLRPYDEVTLSNGLKVLFVKDQSLPRIQMTALLRVGAINDPRGEEGLSSLTARMLEEGTTDLPSNKLAEELAFQGIDLQSHADQEKTSVSVASLSKNREQTLDLFVKIMTSPAFWTVDLNRKKTETIASLKKIRENPSEYAEYLISKNIFPDHVYGRLIVGEAKTIQKIDRSDVVRHYFKYYRPNNAWLAVAGDFDDKFRESVIKKMAAWSQGASVGEVAPALTLSKVDGIRLYSAKGLPQTQIRFGSLGIPRKDPDFLPLRLASVILGGVFESRLNRKIRGELGLTYSISSHFNTMKEGGSFEISTFSRNEKAADLIRETRKMVREFIENGVTSAELNSAKTYLISQFPASVETASETAMSLLRLRFYEVSDSYLQNLIESVEKVSKSDVNAAIQKHLKLEDLHTVVYGDEAQILKSLQALGEVHVETVSEK